MTLFLPSLRAAPPWRQTKEGCWQGWRFNLRVVESIRDD
jgi:hypothetical protein